MTRCPLCVDCVCTIAPPRRRKRRKQPARRYTVSVSAKAFELFKAAAEVRGMSVRQLVEVACAD